MEKFWYCMRFIAKIQVFYRGIESILEFTCSLWPSGHAGVSGRAVLSPGCCMRFFLNPSSAKYARALLDWFYLVSTLPLTRERSRAVEEGADCHRKDFPGQLRKRDWTRSRRPFPRSVSDPQLGDACGLLLEKDFNLCTGDKKTMYFNCVRVICKRGLATSPVCIWVETKRVHAGGSSINPRSPKGLLTSNVRFYTLSSHVALFLLFLTPPCQTPALSVFTLFIVLASVKD